MPLRPNTNGAIKRTLADATIDSKSGNIERPAKRSKGDEEGGTSAFFTDGAPQKPSTSKVKMSPRTEKYLYSSPTQPSNITSNAEEGEEEADSEEVRARKEDLHRKFVKKLGHPDSLAQIRRRNWQGTDDAGAGDGADGEGDDEEAEEEAPVPKAKRKGAKTGKLTPLEIQVLDIKRKHMDTLLIVEVGYKFKFFGEDARTAAKELSIVCIPGKYRYDERRLKEFRGIRHLTNDFRCI